MCIVNDSISLIQEFPESLSKESRVFIHKFVEKNGFNLKTKSFGKGNNKSYWKFIAYL